MNNKIKYLFALIIFSLANINIAHAQDDVPDPLSDKEKYSVIESIVSDYTPWKEVSLSGKLSSSLLPISPSVKIYMEKGKLVVISVSAPLIGEAARIEVDEKEALVVNKMANSYATVSSEMMEKVCPGGLEAFQNLILGRITLLGSGELSRKDAGEVEIYSIDNGNYMVLPNQDLENAPYVYMFFVEPETYKLARFVVMTQDGEGSVDTDYTWGKNNMTMDFEAELSPGNLLRSTLKLNNPDSSVKKISRIELGSKYRQTDIFGLLKF